MKEKEMPTTNKINRLNYNSNELRNLKGQIDNKTYWRKSIYVVTKG